MIYVLDASAILRYLDDEPGSERVETIINLHLATHDRIVVSAVQWGEVAYILLKRRGPVFAESTLLKLRNLALEVVPASQDRAERAAFIKDRCKIPYADAFAVELTSESAKHVLITADFDFKPVEQEIAIEFLPARP